MGREQCRSFIVSHTFNRNQEALATSKPTVQRRVRQSARTPYAGPDRRVIVDEISRKSLADQIAAFEGALTARQVARVLSISAISVYKMAKRGALPSLRIGGCVRFCPRTIARWLRERGG